MVGKYVRKIIRTSGIRPVILALHIQLNHSLARSRKQADPAALLLLTEGRQREREREGKMCHGIDIYHNTCTKQTNRQTDQHILMSLLLPPVSSVNFPL